MQIPVTVGIPTKERYSSLSQTLLSIALQTYIPKEVIIVDDTPSPVDIRTLPGFPVILELFNQRKIQWKVLFGQKRGQHLSHEIIQEQATTDWIFRIDDDCIAESDVLEKLWKFTKDKKIGAIAPSVLLPNPQPLPDNIINTIKDLTLPNMQWFTSKEVNEVDHLYSCFLYKKGIAEYSTELSPVSHREETMFTYSIKKAGYKLIVNSNAVVWHFREQTGGIRSGTNPSMWEHDEKIFKKFLEGNKVISSNKKLIVLDCGIGDHFAFKHILKDLQKKYKDIVIAASYPDVFFDVKNIKLISIAEAKMMGEIDQYNIYRKMIEWHWRRDRGDIIKAFKKLYL